MARFRSRDLAIFCLNGFHFVIIFFFTKFAVDNPHLTINMKKLLISAWIATIALTSSAEYIPTPENIASREEFEDARFGIFLHWGLYSMFAQGEWYLNYGPNRDEYAKSAKAFYPADFDAAAWVKAIKNSGAKYVCLTTRHHDGFSMWHTSQSDYNIVDATPFKRDILKEFADECHRQGLRLHLYYSHIDWTRDDYPWGRTGRTTGKDPSKADWPAYYKFMNAQLTELLTQYGPIGAIWFDGYWDRDEDPEPFDWQLDEQYALVHKLQPSCLIGNNHHENTIDGEDIQIFERDIPGQNLYGYSEQQISHLPLETCQTMNGMWGYKLRDQNYKSTDDLIQYLVNTAAKGANLLLNIGPQPNGELPATALDRLSKIGEWMKTNGETIYGTSAAGFEPQSWGCATRKGDRMFIHIMNAEAPIIYIPTDEKVISAKNFADGSSVKTRKEKKGISLLFDNIPEGVDHIVELKLK